MFDEMYSNSLDKAHYSIIYDLGWSSMHWVCADIVFWIYSFSYGLKRCKGYSECLLLGLTCVKICAVPKEKSAGVFPVNWNHEIGQQ